VTPFLRVLAFVALLGTGTTDAREAVARGRLVEGVTCLSDPSQSYTLYLPSVHTVERTWPTLLVFDPRGRSRLAAERFTAVAEELGWVILSSDGTRSDGPMEPNLKALQALWSEIHTRLPTDRRRVYAAGFSGLGNVACDLGAEAGLAGVIVSGSRWTEERAQQPIRIPCFGTAGDTDFNFTPMRELHERLREWGTPERLETFTGGHSWMPVDLATLAVEWMEIQAMKQDLRAIDGELVGRVLARDRDRARSLEEAGRLLAAERLYERAALTVEGLAPIDDLRREAARLAEDPATRRARQEEERWERFEMSTLRRQGQAYRMLATADPPPLLAKLRRELDLDDLLRRSSLPGAEGVVARRLLNMVATQTGFYVPRELMGQGEAARAALSLAVATELRPDHPELWYDLGRARARMGATGAALEALETAVRLGFEDRTRLVSDPDLDSLHREERFRALVTGSSGAPPDGPE
jgi:predicted esterase